MKMYKKRFVALMLAVSLILGNIYIYAEAATIPEIGNYSNLVNLDNTKFYKNKENYGPVSLSEAVQGDNWYLSTTVKFDSLTAWQGPKLAFATGTVTQTKDGTTTVKDDMIVRLQIRNTDENKGQYLLDCASIMYNVEEYAPVGGSIGAALEVGQDYRVTIQVENRDKLSMWVNDAKVMNGVSLSQYGITNLKPSIGWRAYTSTGILKDIQVWDGVTAKPVFDEATDQNAAPVSELSVDGTSGYAQKELEHVVYGDKYYLYGRVNAENSQNWGSLRFLVAEVQNADNTKKKVSVCLRPGSSGTNVYNQIAVFSNNDNNSGETALYTGTIPTRIAVGKTYTYTVIYDAGTISFYVDDVLAVNRLKLDGTVTPKVGLYANCCAGEVTDMKLWGDVQSSVVRPVFDETTDRNSAVLEEVPVTALENQDVMLYEGIAYDYEYQYQYSGTVQISKVKQGSQDYGIGMLLGTAVCDSGQAVIEARYQPASKRALLLLRTASEERVLKSVVLEEQQVPDTASFTYTGRYDNGEVTFWLNDTLIFSRADIRKADGVTNVSPKAGIAGYQCNGNLSNMKIWGATEKEDQVFYQRFQDIGTYRELESYTAPAASGYVFAGWYQDEEGKRAVGEKTVSGSAYARFVPEQVLSVKAQMTSKTTLSTKQTDLRFITTVDSLQYKEIGYDITVNNGKTVSCPGTKVYKKILAINGLGSISYQPETFHACSDYFYAYNITNIPQSGYSMDIKVSPYWITKDGTKAIGVVRTMRVKDGCLVESSSAPITEVFHDPSDEYISTVEPQKNESVTVRIRTERDTVTSARVYYKKKDAWFWSYSTMEFDGHDATGYYDYFSGTIPGQDDIFYYQFRCSNKSKTVYLDRNLTLKSSKGSEADCWVINPGYETPDWSKGALWYSLIPDSFYNGDTSNDLTESDVNGVNSWNQNRLGLADKYGGDLAGVTEKLEHIKSLSADAVYMNPIFKANQTIGYGQVDFMQIDSSFGTAKDLRNMNTLLHKNGLKVMMDAVLTFVPWDSLYLDKNGRYPLDGAEESESSVYGDLFLTGENSKYVDSGWAGPTINNSSETAKKLFYTQKDSFLRYYPAQFGIDGWRFDCGGAIQGVTAEGVKESSAQIMAQIRSYLKADNPDLLLISEYSGDDDMMGDSWDGRWNDYYMTKIREYAQGTLSESGMNAVLKTTVHKFPRSVALSMYNLVTSHDESRLDISDSYMERAMILLQMNYLGSPCIYYGEEIGIGRDSHNSAMDWDESNWDYEKYNFYRALGELRTKYSAVKTGAIRDVLVSDEQNLYAFGRWDEKGTVVTVSSQNAETVSVDLNVRTLSVADGTVFTDWLTGKQYQTDANGILHVDVVPGGSIFVSGKEASSYRQIYEVTKAGSSDAGIIAESDGTYTLKGNGSTLVTEKVYGAGSVSGLVRGEGSVLFTMRQTTDDLAASYNVTIDGDKLTITARKNAGGELLTVYSTEYTKGKAVRIERDEKNHFYTSMADISYSGKQVSDWKRIAESEVVLEADRDMVAGFAPLDGCAKLKNVRIENDTDKVLSDTFESGKGSALLNQLTTANATVTDGKLVLDGTKGMEKVVTDGKSDDWTFRAKLDSSVTKAGTYAGVLCAGGSTQYVAVGRTVLNGTHVLYVGRTTDGTMEIDEYIEDTAPNDSVILQIQRTGTSYTAVASYDGMSWKTIGGSVFANYSLEEPGVFADGVKATIDDVCFGDSIEDGKSVNTPHAEAVVDMDYSSTVAAKVSESASATGGNWEYGKEGYHQTDASAGGCLSLNKIYEDVRVNVTLKQEGGQGYAAIGFGQNFLLKYTTDQKLILMKGDTVLQDVKAPEAGEDGLRVVLEVRGETVCVYAGEKSSCVIRVEDSGYTEGYITLVTSGIKAGFLNYRFSSLDAGWRVLSGTVTGGANSVTCTGTASKYGAVTRMGIGVTDFVMTTVVRLGTQAEEDGPSAEGGILFGAPEGASATKRGISVSLVSGGVLKLNVDGTTVKEYSLGETVTKAVLLIVKKDSLIQIYVQGTEGAVLSYTDSISRGGAIQLYSLNATTTFSNLGLEDITGRKVAETTLYQNWQNNVLPSIVKKYGTENFNNEMAWKHLTKYATDHGTWTIKDGMLSCVAAPKYISGVAIYDSVYQDFKLTFKYRYDAPASNVYGYVAFRKAAVNQSHLDACYWLRLGYDGSVTLFYGDTQLKYEKCTYFTTSDWTRLTVECKGDSISVKNLSQDGQYSSTILEYTVPDGADYNTEGFISFASNQSLYSVDDVTVTPITE